MAYKRRGVVRGGGLLITGIKREHQNNLQKCGSKCVLHLLVLIKLQNVMINRIHFNKLEGTRGGGGGGGVQSDVFFVCRYMGL